MADINHEVREKMRLVVVETIGVMQQLELQLPRITQMNVHNVPVGVLAFQLYGKNYLDRTQTLLDLNPEQPAMLFHEEVNILHGE